MDPVVVTERLRSILDLAEHFISEMPSGSAGLLFLQSGRAVQPDPNRLGDYQSHAGRRRGQWPTSPEILASMLESQNGRDGQS